jgi:hypothetical protein
MVSLGTDALSVVFALGGVCAALAGTIAGIRLLLANVLGSGYALGQAISSLIVAMIGLALMLAGPSMASMIVRGVGGIGGVAGLGGAWGEGARGILIVIIQLGAVIAAVGISWNAVLMILDSLFSASPEPSPVALNRILAISLLLGMLILVPEVTNRVVAATSGVIR